MDVVVVTAALKQRANVVVAVAFKWMFVDGCCFVVVVAVALKQMFVDVVLWML